MNTSALTPAVDLLTILWRGTTIFTRDYTLKFCPADGPDDSDGDCFVAVINRPPFYGKAFVVPPLPGVEGREALLAVEALLVAALAGVDESFSPEVASNILTEALR